MDTLPLIVWYLDDPVADPALVPLYFIAREARKHVKVVLSGEGADELFGGYTIYREPISLRPFERVPRPVRRGLAAVSERLPEGMRGKDLLRRGSIGIEERYYGNARIFRPDEMGGLLRGYDPAVSYTDVTRPHYAATEHLDGTTRMQYVDLFTWLRGDILVKADKMTMANSLELRVPFLDTEVFAVASTIPTSEKITRETTKYALRRALADIVPAHVLDRAKLGFPVPIRHWLKDVMYDWAREIVTASQADELIDLRRGAAAARRAPHRAGGLLAQDLDGARLPALARDLRRAADPPRRARAGLPRPTLTARSVRRPGAGRARRRCPDRRTRRVGGGSRPGRRCTPGCRRSPGPSSRAVRRPRPSAPTTTPSRGR